MGEPKDWNNEIYPNMVHGLYGKSLVIGMGEAKKICEGFLSWYYDYLAEHEPYATHTMSDINQMMEILNGDLNEVLATE